MPRLYPAMLRASPDYAKGMTDAYATTQANAEAVYRQLDDAQARASLAAQEAAHWKKERDRASVLHAAARAQLVVSTAAAYQRGAQEMRAEALNALQHLKLTSAYEAVATVEITPPADL